VRIYFTGTEFLYDYNANLSKAVGAKRLPLTILCGVYYMSTLTFGVSGHLFCNGLKLGNPTAATTVVGYTIISVGSSECKSWFE